MLPERQLELGSSYRMVNDEQTKQSSLTTMIFDKLQQFRQAVYNRLSKAKDAVFELMDAVLVSPSVSSFVSLSLSPLFRRQWPNVYAALEDGRPLRSKLMRLYLEQIPTRPVRKFGVLTQS